MQNSDQTSTTVKPGYCRIVVLISGRGSNLGALAESFAASGSAGKIVAVVSDNAKAAGLEIANTRGIPVAIVPRLRGRQNDQEFNTKLATAVASFSPDLVVLAGFMRILTAEFVQTFADRIINIHPSLLPSFRGLHPHRQALDAGVHFTGCTVHFVTEEVDGGPIIAQAVVPVFSHDSEQQLADRELKMEHQILPAAAQGIARGSITLVRTDGIARVQITADMSKAITTAFLTSIS